jgi:hypothetical protein
MLNSLILQSASVGFLLHWIISDGLYLRDHPLTEVALYTLFIANMAGIAYAHTVLTRNKELGLALKAIEPSKPSKQ